MMKQTTLTALLTVAVIALVVDRVVPRAEADGADPHVMIGTANMGMGWGTSATQEFSSLATCEAGAKAYRDQFDRKQSGTFRASCVPL